ncbi:SUSD5 protein, partial [Polypterus senegalus]|nr:SUSD5 protein [Polypterus senegalus]
MQPDDQLTCEPPEKRSPARTLKTLTYMCYFSLPQVSRAGKVFTVESKEGSQGMNLAEAQEACRDHGARLASADDLKRAVEQCSFMACSRGWLVDATVGTTVCNGQGSGQQIIQAVDVKIERPDKTDSLHDSFCVKDKDKPCGDPPSFPHTALQGHTGFEMGDELLYVCTQGYVMANYHNAFSLQCDSCGEWYGLVQACVKDETEAHIDYEDKFPDEKSIMVTHPEDKSTTDRREGVSRKVGEEEELEDSTGRAMPEPGVPTDSPISLLSQKHLFWITSQSTPEAGEDIGTKKDVLLFVEDNQTGVKFISSEHVGAEATVSQPPELHNGTTASTDETWLDGYPVTQEAGEEVTEATDQFNQIEISKAEVPSSISSPTVQQEHTTITQVPSALLTTLRIAAVIPTLQTEGKSLLTAGGPYPTSSCPQMQDTSTLSEFKEFADKGNLTGLSGERPLATEEPCLAEQCDKARKGPIIAIALSVICLLVLTSVLAIWCHKRKQRKSSVYKMNGKDQSRQPQQMEMQQQHV